MPKLDEKQEKSWGMGCHLAALAGFIFPFGNIIGPLVIWLIKKDEMPAVDQHGKEALNFNISISIYGLALGAFTVFTFGFAVFLTAPLILALVVFHVVCVILAAIKASNGEFFRYPLSLRLVK